MNAPFYNFLLTVMREFGPYALVCIGLCIVVWYQERKIGSIFKAFLAMQNKHDADRDDWFSSKEKGGELHADRLTELHKTTLDHIKESATKISELTVAVNACSRR